jgi:hypothetical protein
MANRARAQTGTFEGLPCCCIGKVSNAQDHLYLFHAHTRGASANI